MMAVRYIDEFNHCTQRKGSPLQLSDCPLNHVDREDIQGQSTTETVGENWYIGCQERTHRLNYSNDRTNNDF